PMSGCWIWLMSCTDKGYGQIKTGGRSRLAHIVSYEQFVGPVPAGRQLDHKCRLRCCINYDHLEPVTASTNVRRGRLAEVNRARLGSKLVCPHGHPYSGHNLYINPRGARECQECRKRRRRAWNNTDHGRALRSQWDQKNRRGRISTAKTKS